MGKHGNRSPVGVQRWIQAKNVGSYEIPSFGLVEWTESTNPDTGEILLSVKRPTQDGLLNFAINGPTPIPVAGSYSSGTGLVTTHFPAYVAVSGSPVAFQPLGTVANSFLAGTNRPGMIGIGDLTNGRMRVTYGGVDPKAIGAPSGAITARAGTQPGGGTFVINRIVGGVLVATVFSVAAYHLGTSYLESDIAYAHLTRDFFGEWWIDDVVEPELECEVGSGVAQDTECLLTDKLCFLVGNGRVREVTFPHNVKVRDVSAANADCNENAIGTIDLCNLPCTGSGGVDEACFEAMQNRDFVLSLTGGITADVTMDFQGVAEWADLVANDATWAGTAETGWRAFYTNGTDCDFYLYLTYEPSEGWVYWINSYEDRQVATVTTCEPFNIEIVLNCGEEPTIIEDGCCNNVPSPLTATVLAGSTCTGLIGETFSIAWNAGNSRWEGSKVLACGDTLSLWMACDSGNDYNTELTIDKGSGSPSSESATQGATATCEPFELANLVYLIPSGIVGDTNCCSNGDDIRITISAP